MAEVVVKFFIQRLNFLVLNETQIFSGLTDHVASLKNKLNEVGRFFEKLEQKTEKNDDFVHSSIHKLRDVVHKMDDCFDGFILQMGKQNVSNQTEVVDQFRDELEKSEFSLDKIVKEIIEGDELSSAIFKLIYSDLPYYLQSCLMYCCIFPENYPIAKGRLVRLLVAEALVQEKEGEIIEDIAEENIKKLVEMGLIRVEERFSYDGTMLKVPNKFRRVILHKMEEECFAIACTSSDIEVPLSARRASVHSDASNIPSNLNSIPLRSLLVFGIKSLYDLEFDCLRPVFQGVKFLRVLDLEDIQIKCIPDEVGDLVHLRYLGLKKSDLDALPDTVSDLLNLQTLDIRWNGNIASIPSKIVNLVQLRHLKMFKNSGLRGMVVPSGIGGLQKLLTLTGVYVGGGIAAELEKLRQLRRLGVMDLAEDHADQLYESVKKMCCLLSLSLEAKHTSFYGEALPSLEPLSPPPLLRKLRLEGRLETIPNWFALLENLTKLRLGFSHLSVNPGSVLQLLPNLKHLTLWQAYDAKQIGREFCGVGGFPKLEVFVLASLVLEEWTELEEGAFPSLKVLFISNCSRLRMLPEGLQNLTSLEKLDLWPLLDEHEQRLKPNGGEENYKIKNIPEISYITTSMVQHVIVEGRIVL